jgi:hypothetical protein
MQDILETYFDEAMQEYDNLLLFDESSLVQIDECGVYYDPIHEAAKYKFLPKIKRNEDLKKLWKDCEEAEDLLNDNGKDVDKRTIIKIGDLALRIYRALDEASCIILLPINLTIIGIPFYLMCRLIVYVERLGEDALGKMYARKAISSLRKLKNDSKNPKVVKKCDDQIDKLNKAIKEFEEN